MMVKYIFHTLQTQVANCTSLGIVMLLFFLKSIITTYFFLLGLFQN